MVWPILISVAVTPRISADVEATGHASAASALSAPNLVTKRIDVPPLFVLRAARLARFPRLWGEACHGTWMNANRYSVSPSLRANGSRECAPDDRLREAIHVAA